MPRSSFRFVRCDVSTTWLCKALGSIGPTETPEPAAVGSAGSVFRVVRAPFARGATCCRRGSRCGRSTDEEAQERTNYPLSAIVLPGEQLELKVSYQEQALEAELVSRMLDLWQQVLQTLVQQPQQPLAALPLVSETERALLDRWNATEQAYPQEVCVHELFEQQAQRQPQAIALVQGETSLTYGELDRRANQLAHSL